MANISMELIKKLRDMTQAGVMDAKKALEQNNGDIEASVQWLREKGIAKAAKKADAVSTEGIIKVLIKEDKGIILEVNSQTDFVATNELFKELVNDIALTLIDSAEYDIEKATKLQLVSGKGTIESACNELTGKIGEKISLRRFQLLVKESSQQFAHYEHFNGKTGVLLILNTKIEEKFGKDVAMHAAAMAPKFLSKDQVDKE
jgi:elongation factor Ts